MKGFVQFARYCSGEHDGPVTFTKTYEQAGEILGRHPLTLRCTCGVTFVLSPEELESVRRQLDGPEGGGTASA